jgi:hypothetical protein
MHGWLISQERQKPATAGWFLTGFRQACIAANDSHGTWASVDFKKAEQMISISKVRVAATHVANDVDPKRY